MGNRSSPSLRVRGGNEREKASPVFLVAEGEAVRRRRRGSFGIPLSNRLPTYLHLPIALAADRSENKDCVSYSIKFITTPRPFVRPSLVSQSEPLSFAKSGKQTTSVAERCRLSRIYFNLRRVYERAPHAFSFSLPRHGEATRKQSNEGKFAKYCGAFMTRFVRRKPRNSDECGNKGGDERERANGRERKRERESETDDEKGRRERK